MSEAIGKFILELVAYGGGATALAFVMFRFLGKSWIESKFAQRLDQHRHLQAVELQRLRVEIDSLLSGTVKLQEKEFEVLPEAWKLLDVAYGQVLFFTSPGREYSDLDRMNPTELEEFLEGSSLLESQKDQIRNASNKLHKYREVIHWHELHHARTAFKELLNYISRQGIFLPADIKSDFERISDLLWSSIVDKEVGVSASDNKMQNDGWRKLKSDVEPLYKEIGSKIQRRLHSHGDAKPSNN